MAIQQKPDSEFSSMASDNAVWNITKQRYSGWTRDLFDFLGMKRENNLSDQIAAEKGGRLI